jgi:hypothetical protein
MYFLFFKMNLSESSSSSSSSSPHKKCKIDTAVEIENPNVQCCEKNVVDKEKRSIRDCYLLLHIAKFAPDLNVARNVLQVSKNVWQLGMADKIFLALLENREKNSQTTYLVIDLAKNAALCGKTLFLASLAKNFNVLQEYYALSLIRRAARAGHGDTLVALVKEFKLVVRIDLLVDAIRSGVAENVKTCALLIKDDRNFDCVRGF